MPDASISSTSRCVSGRSTASGFSQKIGMPRARPARTRVGCALELAAMTSASAPAIASSMLAAVAPTLGRDRDRALGVGIGHDEGAGLEQVGEDRGVHRADPSRTELRDAHQATASRTATRRAYSSTRRPIAAASDGRSHDESCSTISHPS